MSSSKEWIPHLKLIGGALCLDFANTTGRRIDPQGEEALRDYEDLVSWSEHAGAVTRPEARTLARAAASSPARAAAAHRRAVALREALYRTLSAAAAGRDADPSDLELLNRHVDVAALHLALAPVQGGYQWTWRAVEGELDLPAWRIAHSAAELLVAPDLVRVRECSGDRCDWLFLDDSRNHSRRWCDMASCGNRAKARRNYARRKAVVRPGGRP